jgi:uncharacterized protein with FMN-binding domain
MKKLLMLIALLIIFTGYSFYEKQRETTVKPGPIVSFGGQVTKQPDNTARSPAAKYKDGMYTGASEDEIYGILQVQAVINKGKINNVLFLHYPNEGGETIAVNTYAMPLLKQEAIRSQSAQVNIITGATQTSQAFTQSLEAALLKAL